MNRRVLMAAMAVVVAVGLSTYGTAHPGNSPHIHPHSQSQNVHQVTVVNQMGYPIRLKVMGYRHAAHFVSNLSNHGSTTQNFYGGERVVCVWNHHKQLMLNVLVNFDQPGVLILKPAQYFGPNSAMTLDPTAAIPVLEID